MFIWKCISKSLGQWFSTGWGVWPVRGPLQNTLNSLFTGVTPSHMNCPWDCWATIALYQREGVQKGWREGRESMMCTHKARTFVIPLKCRHHLWCEGVVTMSSPDLNTTPGKWILFPVFLEGLLPAGGRGMETPRFGIYYFWYLLF